MMAEEKQVIDSQPASLAHEDEVDKQHATERDPTEILSSSQHTEAPVFKVLKELNQLEVVQRLDTLEVCLGWTRNNRYCIFSEEGEQIFYVYEASVCFHRQLTGALRGLALKVSLCDEDQEDVLLLRRPGACSSRCCWACCSLQHMGILDSFGTVLANMQEVWSCCIPEYHMTDSKGDRLWRVRGGACHCRCCCLLRFQYLDDRGEEIASITRSCQGCKEIIGAANTYTVHFSDKCTPKEKLTILGSSFLIDLNYFEKQNKCW